MRRAALVACVSVLACACSQTPPAPQEAVAATSRGRLLYETACVACHTAQAHWREKSVVHDWPDLVGQVARWQKIAGQAWSDADIREVAAYLNQRFYKLPAPEKS